MLVADYARLIANLKLPNEDLRGPREQAAETHKELPLLAPRALAVLDSPDRLNVASSLMI